MWVWVWVCVGVVWVIMIVSAKLCRALKELEKTHIAA